MRVRRWLAVVITLAALAGCVNPAATRELAPTPTPNAADEWGRKIDRWLELYGGEVKVYELISTSTDCVFLVSLLDNDNLGYAVAAGDRGTELNCP